MQKQEILTINLKGGRGGVVVYAFDKAGGRGKVL